VFHLLYHTGLTINVASVSALSITTITSPASNRRVSKWLSESIEIEIPAVMPQSIESGGVMT